MELEREVAVLHRRVEDLDTDLRDFKAEQAVRWQNNSNTHKDLYGKLDRLPAWATLVISFLTLLLGIFGSKFFT